MFLYVFILVHVWSQTGFCFQILSLVNIISILIIQMFTFLGVFSWISWRKMFILSSDHCFFFFFFFFREGGGVIIFSVSNFFLLTLTIGSFMISLLMENLLLHLGFRCNS